MHTFFSSYLSDIERDGKTELEKEREEYNFFSRKGTKLLFKIKMTKKNNCMICKVWSFNRHVHGTDKRNCIRATGVYLDHSTLRSVQVNLLVSSVIVR